MGETLLLPQYTCSCMNTAAIFLLPCVAFTMHLQTCRKPSDHRPETESDLFTFLFPDDIDMASDQPSKPSQSPSDPPSVSLPSVVSSSGFEDPPPTPAKSSLWGYSRGFKALVKQLTQEKVIVTDMPEDMSSVPSGGSSLPNTSK